MDFGVNTTLEDFERLLTNDDLEEVPVDLDTFINDPDYLGLKERLSPIQKQMVENMSQIYFLPTLQRIHGDEEGKTIYDSTVNEIICEIGKGGGKDFTLRIAFARIIYYLHCLKDPLAYFQKGGGEYIDLLNIALNAEQAKNIFFDPLINILTASPYFQDRGFEPRAKSVKFIEKPIRCFSGHSGSEGWEGYNLMAVVLDEIAAFKADSEMMAEGTGRYSASAIYNMAKNSVISRFPDVGKVALLSFPRYEGDFIEESYEKAVLEKEVEVKRALLGTHNDEEVWVEWNQEKVLKYAVPKIWAIKCTSFDANPQRKVEDYFSSYVANPVETLSRFFCMPPKAEDAYFRDPDRVRLCFPKDEALSPLDEYGRLRDDFKEEDPDGPPRFIHIDLGLVRDRAALCMVHCTGFAQTAIFDGEKLIPQTVPKVKMDLIYYWEAKAGSEIDFNDIRRLVFALADRFPIAMVTLDRWNSADTINIFRNRGIWAEYREVKKEDYDTLSTTIYDQRLEAYHHEILVEEELLKLQLIKGKKVDHPRTGFKDGSDALAGSVWNLTDKTPYDETVEVEILGHQPSRPRPKKEPAPDLPTKEIPPDLDEWLERMSVL